MAENIFLGLGSNKGNKLDFIKKAAQKIQQDNLSIVEIVSSIYESEPFGNKQQDYFLNTVMKVSCERSLKDFCNWIKSLEKEIGRVPGEKWGPREIDIDLLFYNDSVYNDGNLLVPHKELLLRDFVVVPMKEIAPEFEHPVQKIKMKDIDVSRIEKLIFNEYKVNLLVQ